MSKTFLALCDSAWKKYYEKYIFIDDSCVNGIKYCKENGKNFDVVNRKHLQNKHDRDVYLQTCKEKVLPILVQELNKYHNIKYNEAQWQLLIGSWLNTLLFQFYDKYCKILSFNSYYDEQVNIILVEHDNDGSPPLDFAEFMDRSSNSDDYHLMMYDDLLQIIELNNSINIIEKKQFQYHFDYSFHIHSKYKAKIYNFLIQIYKSITRKNDKLVFSHCYFPKGFTFRMMKKSKGYITDYITNWYLMDRQNVPNTIDWLWRKNSISSDGLEHFEKIVCKLVKKYMPITYVEGFSFLMKRMKYRYRYAMNPNAIMYSCVQGQADEIFKVYLMEMKKNGVTLCDVQHGGNYSIDTSNSFSMEYDACDIFYTWGWTLQTNSKCLFKPMPISKMFDITITTANDARNDNTLNDDNYILYINYLYPKHATSPSYRVEFHAINQEEEIDFLKNLDERVKKRMKFRIYPEDYGWHFKDKLKAISKEEINYDTNHSLYKSLEKARLVIITDWSTTAIEALTYNKPTIILRKSENEIEEAAKPYIQRLIDAGIVVENWYALKKKVEEISNSIEIWWYDQKRQNAISAIKKRYAYLPINARYIWETEVLSYIM